MNNDQILIRLPKELKQRVQGVAGGKKKVSAWIRSLIKKELER